MLHRVVCARLALVLTAAANMTVGCSQSQTIADVSFAKIPSA